MYQKFTTRAQVGRVFPLAASTAIAGGLLYQRLRKIGKLRPSLEGKKVLIAGGSRGLGLALAEQYAACGADLVLCARNGEELEGAKQKLSHFGSSVVTLMCDITHPEDVENLTRDAIASFGQIDILVNNAGIMEVGPISQFDVVSFQRFLDANLMGMIRVTLGFLPHMKEGSRIVNITSIGAAVAVPHLLPYCVAKFGALGFSLGLDAELAQRKISVTSILPGLMRTGSFVHVKFLGNSQKEFDWFALGSTLPIITISARRAVDLIISAAQERRRFVVLGPQAKVLRHLFQLFPETLLSVMRIVNRLLPKAEGKNVGRDAEGRLGFELRKDLPKGGVTRLGDRAGDELNENPAA
jgi:short-subunit dehydrogenase